MPLMDPLGTGAAEAAPSTGRGYWQNQPPAQGGVVAGDVVLPWPRHPRAAVAAAGAVPCSWGHSGPFQPGGAQLRHGSFGGDARFAKAFVPLVPPSAGVLGIVAVFGLETLP